MAKDQKPGPTQFNFESFMTAAVYNVTLQEAYVAFKKAKSLKDKAQFPDARLSEFVDDMAVLAQKLNHGGIAM